MGCAASTPDGDAAEGAALEKVEDPALIGEGAAMVKRETVVDGAESAAATATRVGLSKAEAMPLALEATPITLTRRLQLTRNVSLYRFGFATPDMVLGMRVKSIIMLKAAVGDIQVGSHYSRTLITLLCIITPSLWDTGDWDSGDGEPPLQPHLTAGRQGVRRIRDQRDGGGAVKRTHRENEDWRYH
jgi:hypothetical protein